MKTPGKYTVCVSGKRKPHKGRNKSESSMNETQFPEMDLTSMATNVTSSSLMVNTSMNATTDYFEDTVDEILQTESVYGGFPEG